MCPLILHHSFYPVITFVFHILCCACLNLFVFYKYDMIYLIVVYVGQKLYIAYVNLVIYITDNK